jgi:hypothetical protein
MARLALGHKSSYSVQKLCSLAACLAQLADVQHMTEADSCSAQCAAFLQVVDKEVHSKVGCVTRWLSNVPGMMNQVFEINCYHGLYRQVSLA